MSDYAIGPDVTLRHVEARIAFAGDDRALNHGIAHMIAECTKALDAAVRAMYEPNESVRDALLGDNGTSPSAPPGAVALLRRVAGVCEHLAGDAAPDGDPRGFVEHDYAIGLRALADAIEKITPARIDLVRLIALHEDERSADRGTPFYATRAAQLRDVADLLAALRA